MKKQTITYLFRSALLIGMLLPIIHVIPAVGQRQVNKKRSVGTVPSVAEVPVPNPGTGCGWTHSGAMPVPGFPIPILDEAVASLGGTLYTFAGESNCLPTASSYRFDGT